VEEQDLELDELEDELDGLQDELQAICDTMEGAEADTSGGWGVQDGEPSRDVPKSMRVCRMSECAYTIR
jgi:hypothetical protein